MASRLAVKPLSVVVFSTIFLVACGGGSDSDNSASSSVPENVIPNEIDKPSQENQSPNTNQPVSNDAQAALVANNTFSIARTSCGLGGLSADQALENIASRHSHYIKHVFANTTPTVFNPHYENKIANIAEVTSSNNPFFSGSSLIDRIVNAKFSDLGYGVTENISQNTYYSSAGNFIDNDIVASSMARSLLSAPYHLRSLMRPSSSIIGTGFVSYNPHNKDPNNNRGYVLVTHGAVTNETKNSTPKGVFTYPCQDVQGTMTALYNESPNPVEGTNRNLRTDPIGQPIYISVPTAQTIKVSNIKFYDTKRQINIPVSLLDYDNDPHGSTADKLPNNEAFILPLTDSLKSCEVDRKQNQSQQCGLYGNSEYRVSFDVLIDNKTLENKSFTFKTGKVNYS